MKKISLRQELISYRLQADSKSQEIGILISGLFNGE